MQYLNYLFNLLSYVFICVGAIAYMNLAIICLGQKCI